MNAGWLLTIIVEEGFEVVLIVGIFLVNVKVISCTLIETGRMKAIIKK